MTSPFELFPYDILRNIMLYTYVYTLRLPFEEPELDLQVSSPPISASQVCRTWRYSLLSDPTMWACLLIHKMNHNWIMELLRRSGTALLNVFLEFDEALEISTSYNETHKMLFSLFQQIHRFRVLRVRIDCWASRFVTSPPTMQETLAKHIFLYLQQPAPRLEILSLWLDLNYYSSPELSNLGTLFLRDAPNLKRIHHRISLTFQEFGFPVLYNLSEIYLSIWFNIDFDRFLDILELSPSLKLLHVCVTANPSLTRTSLRNREVTLPYLESLVLDVGYMVDLVDSFLQAVVLPTNLEWYINSKDSPDFESPSLLQFLSRAHLTSLRIIASENIIQLFSEEHLVENYHNRFSTNEFAYVHEEAETLVDLWGPLKHAIALNRITYMVLEDLSEFSEMWPTIFKSTSSLKNLVIKESEYPYSTGGVCLRFLFTLMPLSKEILEYIPDMEWDPRLDLPCSDVIPTHNSIPIPLCPLLRVLILELRDPLGKRGARIIRACSGLRRKAGCPLEVHVCCSLIDEETERLLEEDDAIDVSIIPTPIEEEDSSIEEEEGSIEEEGFTGIPALQEGKLRE